MKIKKIVGVLLFIAALSSQAWAAEYLFSIVPQQPPVKTSTNWTPFIERLAKETGIDIKIKVYNKMSDFEEDLKNGIPDFAFMNPLHASMNKIRQQYQPLVRNSKNVVAILFVKKDSPIMDVGGLGGSNIAFVGAKNICSIFVRATLLGDMAGKNTDFTPLYMGSVDNVVKTVLLGKASAGATLDVSLDSQPESMIAQLRILAKTREIPPPPYISPPACPRTTHAGGFRCSAQDVRGCCIFCTAEDGRDTLACQGEL